MIQEEARSGQTPMHRLGISWSPSAEAATQFTLATRSSIDIVARYLDRIEDDVQRWQGARQSGGLFQESDLAGIGAQFDISVGQVKRTKL